MGKPKTPTQHAVDKFSDSVETLLIALAQRPMTPEQVDRLAAVLQRAELDLLRRLLAPSMRSVAAARSRRPAAASRSSSAKGEAA